MLDIDYKVINFPAKSINDFPGFILCDLRSKSHREMQSVCELALYCQKGRFSPHESGIFTMLKCLT